MSFKYSLRHIRRSPYQTFSAFLIMIITFFMVSLFIMLAFISSAILKHFETKPQISAFYPNDTPETEILDIKKNLESTGLTKEVRYISSKEAVEIYKKNTQIDDIDANLDLVSDKILPPSLEVSSWNLQDLKTVKTIVEAKEGVKVIYIEEVVNKLSNWLTGLRMGGLILLILLVVESVLVIWTIIGMRISQRKYEIEVMQLLGATPWYIRGPFILEGMMYGVVGSIIGVIATVILMQSILPGLTAFLMGIPIVPLNPTNFLNTLFTLPGKASVDGVPLDPISPMFVLLLLGIEILIGMCIGAIGSYAAVFRNLKKY